jgi:hypothetical protein
VIYIGGPLLADEYKFEKRKRIQKGLPPALIKIVSKSVAVENGETIFSLEVL